MLAFANWITTISRILAGVIGLAALLLLCFEVVARYFAPQVLPDWGSEVVIYLTIWALFLVVGELALKGEHVHADFVVDRLSERKKWALGLLAAFAGLIFSVLFLWYGYEVVASMPSRKVGRLLCDVQLKLADHLAQCVVGQRDIKRIVASEKSSFN